MNTNNDAAGNAVGSVSGPAGGGMVDATSDKRTVNNVMRHAYRVLSDTEKAAMQRIKDLGLAFMQELHAIGGTDPVGERHGSRELAVAGTKAEEAVMWAVKHITR